MTHSQYPRCPNNMSALWDDNGCSSKDKMAYMGYSMRTPEWRYTAWMNWDIEKRKAKWDEEPYAVELYDHSGPPEIANDFNHCEIVNVADNNKEIVQQFHEQLKAFLVNYNTILNASAVN